MMSRISFAMKHIIILVGELTDYFNDKYEKLEPSTWLDANNDVFKHMIILNEEEAFVLLEPK